MRPPKSARGSPYELEACGRGFSTSEIALGSRDMSIRRARAELLRATCNFVMEPLAHGGKAAQAG